MEVFFYEEKYYKDHCLFSTVCCFIYCAKVCWKFDPIFTDAKWRFNWTWADRSIHLFLSSWLEDWHCVQPVQILLDYVLPLVVCGIASLLWPIKETSKPVTIIMGVVLAAASFFGITNSYSNTAVTYIAGAVIAAGMFVFTYWYLKNKKKYGIVISMVLKYICQLQLPCYPS